MQYAKTDFGQMCLPCLPTHLVLGNGRSQHWDPSRCWVGTSHRSEQPKLRSIIPAQACTLQVTSSSSPRHELLCALANGATRLRWRLAGLLAARLGGCEAHVAPPIVVRDPGRPPVCVHAAAGTGAWQHQPTYGIRQTCITHSCKIMPTGWCSAPVMDATKHRDKLLLTPAVDRRGGCLA